ncbi:multiple epidermal growth factor-like domains protein 10 [Ptychodera flava]|uniref:multiple epidermal growth factor-like domains protein 10 n=1 Tax=Ptychodera flava TaxID=63121 RepID=UPI00396A7C14
MLDGSCVCPSGRYGLACQNICHCPKDTTCDGKTGECICQEGFYGSPPSTVCQRCNCTENAKCDPSEGCVCKSGYYGPQCDKQCPCYSGASCSPEDPDECKCARGWAGPSCAQCDSDILKRNNLPYCEDKCFMCQNGHECKPSDGNCLCLPGWHGNWCDKKCDEGFFGENCRNECTCLNEDEKNYTLSADYPNNNSTHKLLSSMDGYYSEGKLGLAILALLTVAIVPALLMVMKFWQSRQNTSFKASRKKVSSFGFDEDISVLSYVILFIRKLKRRP